MCALVHCEPTLTALRMPSGWQAVQSGVTCQAVRRMSHVTSQTSHLFLLFSQSCVASRWRVSYQRGLPLIQIFIKLSFLNKPSLVWLQI